MEISRGKAAEVGGEVGATGVAPAGKGIAKVSRNKTYRCAVEPLAVSKRQRQMLDLTCQARPPYVQDELFSQNTEDGYRFTISQRPEPTPGLRGAAQQRFGVDFIAGLGRHVSVIRRIQY
jgi:hypothetical protein